jgi:uncharacterized protein YbjT (DUF2867 family)
MVQAILSGGDFVARGLTRDAHSDKAHDLAAQGVEVVEADLFDQASLQKAFIDAYGVYAVTPFWEHRSVDKERAQAKAIADTARGAGVKHVVWSTFEDTRELIKAGDNRMPMLHERYRVPHFDGKAEADAYFADVPTTLMLTTWYFENVFAGAVNRGSDGALSINGLPMGDSKLAGIAAADIGKVALGVFRNPEEFINQTIGIAEEFVTGEELAAIMTKVLGEKVTYDPPTHDDYRNFDFQDAVEFGNMYQYYVDFDEAFLGRRDLALAHRLAPDLQTFEQWLGKHKAFFAKNA